MFVKKQRLAQHQASNLILFDFANLVESDQNKQNDFRMTGLSMGEDIESARGKNGPKNQNSGRKDNQQIKKLVDQLQVQQNFSEGSDEEEEQVQTNNKKLKRSGLGYNNAQKKGAKPAYVQQKDKVFSIGGESDEEPEAQKSGKREIVLEDEDINDREEGEI